MRHITAPSLESQGRQLNPEPVGDGFLSEFSKGNLKVFKTEKSLSAYPAGAFLFVEGQEPKGVFILREGEAKLSVSSSDGKTLVLRIAQVGEALGLFSTFSASPYEATAEAIGTCRVGFISRNDFHRCLRKNPALFQYVGAQLNLQYKAVHERLREVGLGASIHERLSKFLLSWYVDRRTSRKNYSPDFPFTHQELAEFIGTTRESVTRALGMLRRQGLIEGPLATLRIPDQAALQEASWTLKKSGTERPLGL